jgi:hypothetical protein
MPLPSSALLEDLHLSSLFLPIFLAFLVPIAAYCLILSGINRRPHPVMVSGIWDAVGLLLAASGALLAGVPGILAILYAKLGRLPFDTEPQTAADFLGALWLEWLGIWLLYYVLVVAGAISLLWFRRHKTVIYNVGPKQWELIFGHVLSRLGLEQSRAGKSIYLGSSGPLEEPTQVLDPGSAPGNLESAVTESRPLSPVLSRCSALIHVDVFPALCNVTVHWVNPSPPVRQEIETELSKALQRVDSPDNPAASWFLGIGGILLGICFLLVLAVVLFVLFPPRH